MTWVAWRVQRPQLLAAAVGVTALAIWLLVAGLAMGHDELWKYWTDVEIDVLYALPAALGLGIGVPLVASELHDETHRLAWTQSVAPRQWLTRKLIVGAATAISLAAVLSLLVAWWTNAVSLSPLVNSGGFSGVLIQPAGFDITGLVVVAYALFAFFLGAALGAWLRRPGWAFAAGVPIFILVRLAIEDWVRPVLLTPKTVVALSGFGVVPENSWVVHQGVVPLGRITPLSGHPWSFATPHGYGTCVASVKTGAPAASDGAFRHCALAAHVHFVLQYQPATNYWPLQGSEAAIFIAVAAAFAVLTYLAIVWRRA